MKHLVGQRNLQALVNVDQRENPCRPEAQGEITIVEVQTMVAKMENAIVLQEDMHKDYITDSESPSKFQKRHSTRR